MIISDRLLHEGR